MIQIEGKTRICDVYKFSTNSIILFNLGHIQCELYLFAGLFSLQNKKRTNENYQI